LDLSVSDAVFNREERMTQVKDTEATYFKAFLALLALAVLTVGAAYIDLGGFNLPIALLIALLKAFIVIWYFMHIRHSTALSKVFAVAGFVWVGILLAHTFSDYLTRSQPVSPQWKTWVYENASHFKVKNVRDSEDHKAKNEA
jgi:cytochrome c oxidase subunit IV